MGKAVELSNDAYRQLEKLAQQKQCTVEEMVQECVRAYEQAQYDRVHAQMEAEGLLTPRPLPDEPIDDEFEPEVISGPGLSDIILEDRR
jgi:hypothetical protein